MSGGSAQHFPAQNESRPCWVCMSCEGGWERPAGKRTAGEDMCTRGPRKGRGCEVPERGVKAGCGEAGVGNGEAEDEWRGGGAKRRAAAPPLDPARPKT